MAKQDLTPDFFGRKRGASQVFAEWFTGVLRVPQGRQVEYVHAGFASRYEGYLLLQIERGSVVRRWEESGDPKP